MGDPLFWFLAWIASLLAATYVGFDRGRWGMGMALGILCGPIGVVAAGLLRPSLECETERQHELELKLAHLRRLDKAAAKERRHNAQAFDELADALQQQAGIERCGFAEDLNGLARRLDEIVQNDPGREKELRGLIQRLHERAENVQGTAVAREI